mmetsp:Transcript_4953/g.9642  ORF Transcript_4953/g.9642 Transcript_4953/m.9642 type:complete len:237 (+) Transcript_4953:5555-6265(+)
MHVDIIDIVPPIVCVALIRQIEIESGIIVQQQFLALVDSGRAQKLVKDVKVPLPARLVDQPHLFQEISVDGRTQQLSAVGESDINVFSKPAAIVITDGASIPKRLEDGVALQNLLLDARIRVAIFPAVRTRLLDPVLLRGLLALLTQHGEVVQYDFGCHRLPRSGFPAHQNTLIGRHFELVRLFLLAPAAAAPSLGRQSPPSPSHELVHFDTVHHGTVGVVGRLIHVGGELAIRPV